MEEKKYDIYCVGYKRVYYVGSTPVDTAFDEAPETCEKDILCCYVDTYGHPKFEIELATEFGWCGSGYTTASWGSIDCRCVQSFGPLTHVPKDHKPIKIEGAYYIEYRPGEGEMLKKDYIFDDPDTTVEKDLWDHFWNADICNNVFDVSYDGGDGFYPMGGTSINDSLFEELPRAMHDRPVYIFYGESGVGKSTIANLLYEKEVYETDSADNGELPDELWEDVIVLGNKWPNITIDEIKKRVVDSDATIFNVNFSKL